MKKRKSLAATYIKIIIALLIIACGIYFGFRFLNKEYNIEEFETDGDIPLSAIGAYIVAREKGIL